MRGKGIQVRAVVIGADHTATRRSKAALWSWGNGTGKPGHQTGPGPTQNDPAVKAELQYIENAIVNVDTGIMAKYGGVQGISDRLIELESLPKSEGTSGVSIDSYETWVSRRLRMPDAEQ